jgi:CheY-like chemotaxis protein/HD-like signal output (HDOD) protein
MTEPIKVLFVDDEPMVLRSIERLLRARRIPWQSRFVGSAQEALDALGEQPFDVIVSDLRMPNLDGASLLRRAREQFPQVARLVLSGQAATREGVVAMQVAHQCLSKPYDLAILRAAVERLARARRCLESPALVAVVSRFSSLPSPPATYQKLLVALDAGTPLREVEETLERDPALSAKILQLQRSAVLSTGSECHSVSEVLRRVDTELAAAFALGEEMCRPMRDGAALPGDLEMWQRNSVLVARVCRAVAPPALRGQAFSAGILHDIGSLIAASAPAELRPQIVHHAGVGACLLGLWGIEEDVVDAVAHHRGAPTTSDGEPRDRSPLVAALCLAEYVVAEAGYSPQLHALGPGIDASQVDRAREVIRRISAEN